MLIQHSFFFQYFSHVSADWIKQLSNIIDPWDKILCLSRKSARLINNARKTHTHTQFNYTQALRNNVSGNHEQWKDRIAHDIYASHTLYTSKILALYEPVECWVGYWSVRLSLYKHYRSEVNTFSYVHAQGARTLNGHCPLPQRHGVRSTCTEPSSDHFRAL